MKQYLALFLLFICINTFGQTNFNTLVQKIKTSSLPYSSESEQTRQWFVNSEKRVRLRSNDSAYVVEKLKSITRIIVNPNGGTGFGNLDCEETTESRLENIGRIALLYVIKNSTNKDYLLHIEVEENEIYPLWHGILACITSEGEMKSWMYSDGSANGGNPHGNISRDFKILPNNTIKITEGAWGDNTEIYSFNATYKVVRNKFVLIKRKLLIGRKE